LADTIQIAIGAEKELTVANGRRGVGAAVAFVEHVVRQQLEFGFRGGDKSAFVLRNISLLEVSLSLPASWILSRPYSS
jgi:hypothetical protein